MTDMVVFGCVMFFFGFVCCGSIILAGERSNNRAKERRQYEKLKKDSEELRRAIHGVECECVYCMNEIRERMKHENNIRTSRSNVIRLPNESRDRRQSQTTEIRPQEPDPDAAG